MTSGQFFVLQVRLQTQPKIGHLQTTVTQDRQIKDTDGSTETIWGQTNSGSDSNLVKVSKLHPI